MTSMTATEIARNFSRVLDSLEHEENEIAITRNRRTVARLVSGTRHMTALEVLSDIYSTIPPEEGAEWLKDIEQGRRWLSAELRDPWA